MGCNGNQNAPACSFYGTSQQCSPASCDTTNNEQTAAANCDGLGSCDAGVVTSCGNYVCNAGQTACLTTCANHTDCTTSSYCTSNTCVTKKPNGLACALGVECQSDFCVDNVCCDTACDGNGGLCRACDLGGTVGACTFVPDGQDPDNDCTLSCNGSGACIVL
jgi:hypothetical protein